MSFLDVPGTFSSLKVAKANIQDPFSDRSINPSFVPATSSDPFFNSSVISRLIPTFVSRFVPDTEPSNIPYSTQVPVQVNTVTVLPSISNVESNFVSSVLPGSYSSIDTTNNPSLDSCEILSFDANYHQETIPIPSLDRNSIPRLNPRYRPSSFLFIASSFLDLSNSSHSTKNIQFKLLFFTKSSSSSVSSFNGIPFSSHNHKEIGGDIRQFQFCFQLQHFQFRLLFFKVNPENSFSSSIDTSNLSSANIDPDCIQKPSDVPTKEPI